MKKLYIIESTVMVPFLADDELDIVSLVLQGQEAVDKAGQQGDLVQFKPTVRAVDEDDHDELGWTTVQFDDEERTLTDYITEEK